MSGYIFGPGTGIVTDPSQMQNVNLSHMLTGACGYTQNLNPYFDLSDYFRPAPDPRTLDERFADFKIRLAAVVERRKKK